MSDLISRQAAILAITGEPPEAHYPSWYADRIKALPSAETSTASEKHQLSEETSTNTSTDLISRQDAIKNAHLPVIDDAGYEVVRVDDILGLPSAPDSRQRGEWVIHDEVKNIYGGVYIECSECGTRFVTQTLEDERFCRNCGADMRGGAE